MRAFMIVAAMAAFPTWAQTPQKVDPAKSSIRFVSMQMGVPVEGRFRRFDATVAFDPARPEAAKAEFEVELASIDLGNEEAEAEVKRPLWFDTSRFPRARFVLASLKPAGAGKYQASGALTIKGVTLPVAAPVSHTESGGMRIVEGELSMKRLQFRLGEAHWSDIETVADDVLVRFRFTFPYR